MYSLMHSDWILRADQAVNSRPQTAVEIETSPNRMILIGRNLLIAHSLRNTLPLAFSGTTASLAD